MDYPNRYKSKGVLLTIYQAGRAEAAAAFADAPAVPRVGEWFRYTASDGRTFKGLVARVEWMAYVQDRETKMTAGIILDQIAVIATSSTSSG